MFKGNAQEYESVSPQWPVVPRVMGGRANGSPSPSNSPCLRYGKLLTLEGVRLPGRETFDASLDAEQHPSGHDDVPDLHDRPVPQPSGSPPLADGGGARAGSGRRS